MTGLEPRVIEEQELRIDSGVFREMLLRKEKLVLGAYDARVTGRDGDESENHPQIEPFMRGGGQHRSGFDERLPARGAAL